MIGRTLPTRAAWLAARRIGSSDVAALLGVSAYQGPWDVYERLTLGLRPEQPETAAQRRGVRLEPVVLRMYAAETGQRVVRTPPHTLYQREDWATASPDATAGDRIVEAKTDRDPWRWGPPGRISRWEPGAERVVRPDYWLQLQHLLWVCDAPAGDLAVLVPGDDPFTPELRIYECDRDDEALSRIVPRLRAWWERHVVQRIEPDLDASDAAGRALARVERDGHRAATADEERLAAAYRAAAETEKAARDAKQAAGRLLVARAGTARRLSCSDGGHVTVVSSTSSRVLDEGALLAARPDLAEVLDQYRRPGHPYAFPRVVPGRRRDDVVPG